MIDIQRTTRVMPPITSPLTTVRYDGSKASARWDRRVNRWGTTAMEDPCIYMSHFEVGMMSEVETQRTIVTSHIRGCSPSDVVGIAIGLLWTGPWNAKQETGRPWFANIMNEFLALKFNGTDFYCGNRLIVSAKRLLLFKDGTCMAQL